MGNDINDAEDEFPAGRNIGCCSLAAATWGRHFPVCVNGRGESTHDER